MTTENNTRKDTVITTAQAEAINAALRTMHAIVFNWGTKDSLPASFDDLTLEQIDAVLCRTARAIKVRANAMNEQATSKVRAAVSALVAERTEATKKARDAVMALPSDVRATLGASALPSTVSVPLAQLGSILGTSNAATIGKTLKDLGFSVDARTFAKNAKDVHIPFSA